MDYFKHETAVIDSGAQIGTGTNIWHFAHICSGGIIGRNCVLGQNTMVADGVVIGNNVKVQNNVSIYTGVTLEDDVFLGPSCVLTNVTNPRSQIIRRGLYEKTLVKRGATVCANATIVCGVTLGRYCFIAAGTVVTRDVPEYALMMGVPGRQTGWMSRHGHALHFDHCDEAICPESRLRYKLQAGITGSPAQIRCLDIAEDQPLPAEKSVGERPYAAYRAEQ